MLADAGIAAALGEALDALQEHLLSLGLSINNS